MTHTNTVFFPTMFKGRKKTQPTILSYLARKEKLECKSHKISVICVLQESKVMFTHKCGFLSVLHGLGASRFIITCGRNSEAPKKQCYQCSGLLSRHSALPRGSHVHCYCKGDDY